MVAAARAAQAGAGRVVLLEKNNKTGTKILMSGGTRCNLTHDGDSETIMTAFGKSGLFLRQALQQLSPAATVRMFNRLGLATKVEATGKVFPQNDRAVEVRDCLLADALRWGVQIKTGTAVRNLKVSPEGGFDVVTVDQTLHADRVIVTSGGRSWPRCGTTGDGYGWLQSLGHSIGQTHPALVPLVGGAPWTRDLSGLTLPNVRLSVVPKILATANPLAAKKLGKNKRTNKRKIQPLAAREGGLLFTHFGFSGPAPMDVSRHFTAVDGFQRFALVADFFPEWSQAKLRDWFATARNQHGGQSLTSLLAQHLPKRLAAGILAATLGELESDRPLAELRQTLVEQSVSAIKSLDLEVHQSRGFDKAEVTAGGVCLREIDPRTMQSRIIPGLYIAGEVLDLDGWIGGYNFQAAFSTGHVAGQAIARHRREKGG